LQVLINAGKKAVAFLEEQGSLLARADVAAIQRWIGDLDSNTFARRDRASQELALILDEAEPYLRKAHRRATTLGMLLRIKLLLEQRSHGMSGRELQRFRVIEILEPMAAPEAEAVAGADGTRRAAIALLQKLAAGTPAARVTGEARASLER